MAVVVFFGEFPSRNRHCPMEPSAFPWGWFMTRDNRARSCQSSPSSCSSPSWPFFVAPITADDLLILITVVAGLAAIVVLVLSPAVSALIAADRVHFRANVSAVTRTLPRHLREPFNAVGEPEDQAD